MAAVMKTPGVYIIEKNAFPNSVVEVATAVPAFVGYTQKAENKGNTLIKKPWRITSMAEFHQYYGFGPTADIVRFSLTQVDPPPPTEKAKDAATKRRAAMAAKAAADSAATAAAKAPDNADLKKSAVDAKNASDAAENAAADAEKVAKVEADNAVTDEAKKIAADAIAKAKQKDDLDPLAARDAELLRVNGVGYKLAQVKGFYLLYYSLLHFFQNGGGPCYIVSVGLYDKSEGKHIDPEKLTDGIKELEKEQEPTMVVVPEAVLLSQDSCTSVQQAALLHCGDVMKNRVTILDIWKGYEPRSNPPTDCVADFRNTLGTNFLAFGVSYYPWVNTTIVQDNDLSYVNIDKDSQGVLIDCIKSEFVASGLKQVKIDDMSAEVDKIKTLDVTSTDAKVQSEINLLAKTLITISPFFSAIMLEMKKRLNVLPPAAAMAGIYTLVDNSRGVWKAPANVSLNSVVSPTVPISAEQQEDLNVTPQGKSINAIRAFIGEGTLVWGARTLDGNSLDWRYVNVRRTMIMLEESIRLAAKAMVFEPNTANTWVTMKSMIGNFLTGIWKRGGLAGASTEDAFSVHVGLGETMTPEDILEGILRVTVRVALVRPAEFIEITFQQQMQKS
jgi:phage tail sheath protein FI